MDSNNLHFDSNHLQSNSPIIDHTPVTNIDSNVIEISQINNPIISPTEQDNTTLEIYNCLVDPLDGTNPTQVNRQRNLEDKEIKGIIRQHPTELINPTALAKQRRNRINISNTYDQGNGRQPVVPITAGLGINIAQNHNQGSLTTNNQQQVQTVRNAAEQLIYQPTVPISYPVNIRQIDNTLSGSELDEESGKSEDEIGNNISTTIPNVTFNTEVQMGQDGWIDFTTAQGFQEALSLIRADQANGANITAFNGPINTRGNLDNMYFDAETGDEIRRINGVWRNITQEVNGINTNTNVGITAVNRLENVVYNHQDERSYYVKNGELRPLTIDTQADTEPVRDYLLRTINNPTAVSHQIGLTRTFNNIPEIVPALRERINNNIEQLTENLETNEVIRGSINTMTTRQQTIPQIPTIPTPNRTGQRQRPWEEPLVPAIPTEPIIRDGTTNVHMLSTIPTPNITGQRPWENQRVVVPAIPTQATNRNGVTSTPLVPILPTMTGQPTTNAQTRIPVIPRINTGVVMPQMVPTVTPIVRPVTMIVKQPTIETARTVTIPTENPYLRIPRPVLDAIAQERDINLIGTNSERAEQLFEFDHIMPEWIQSVITKTIDNFQVLTGSKLYVFGAVNGVSFDGIGNVNSRELMNYIRVFILTTTPTHPGRDFLPALVNNLGRHLLEIFASRLNIARDNLRFISTDELRRAVIMGRTDHIANDLIAIVAQRYNALRNHKYSHLLDELYNIDGEDDAWINAARTAPHPMEAVILGLDNFSVKQIVDTFGIALPLSCANNVNQYIRNNIVSYANILTRGNVDPIPIDVMIFSQPADIENYLNKLTDNEIHAQLGIYVPYSSRLELVRNTATAFNRPQFMFPTPRNEARSHNKETVINFTPITNLNSFMVCYGTILKYYMYELDELTGSFYRDDDTGAMEFRRPENLRNKFTTQDIEGLRRLLACFAPTPEINDLVDRIDEGLIDAKEKIAYDDTARAQLRNFDNPTKQLIQQFLRQVFYVGMYMRRWQGPGTPFPLKSDTTQNKKEPDAKVTEQLGFGIELLKQMVPAARTFCVSLKICEYNGQGNIDHGQAAFNLEWEAVIKGTQCIRMASSKFVGTGYHYLRSLFRETIPGMDVKAIDRII